jgi:hypothetical protein
MNLYSLLYIIIENLSIPSANIGCIGNASYVGWKMFADIGGHPSFSFSNLMAISLDRLLFAGQKMRN